MGSLQALLAFCLVATAAVAAAPDRAYEDELVERARALGLAGDLQWIRLGHYEKTLTGGWESEADGMGFFLAPDGKQNPASELEATIRGFFGPAVTEAPSGPTRQHASCRFPARLLWLHRKLDFDFTRMPAQSCGRFREFFDRLSARSVSLVFSSYYLNNPASAFGHTFLRTNKAPLSYEGRRYELLDYGIDYSATVDTQNALIYGVKGLTGLFPGNFNYYPYFYKVREYNDYESRDLWEYDLDFTQAEVNMLVAHLWELGSTYFDYYYLTQNCSYHILGALEAAKPELDLTGRVGLVVVPANAVRVTVENAGLVRDVHYRPSIYTQFRDRVDRLSSDQIDLLKALTDDSGAALPRGMEARLAVEAIDAALDWVDVTHAKELIHGTDPGALQKKQELMVRRSEIRLPSEPQHIRLPEERQPEAGHASKRVGLGGGYSTGLGPFGTFDFRLALHDLADPARGYPELAQIEFLPTRLRYNTDHEKAWIEEIWAVRVLSLTSVDAFDLRPSFSIRLGAFTVRDGGCRDCVAGAAAVGGGLARSVGSPAFTLFLLGEAELLGAPDLVGLGRIPLRLGAGPVGGVRLRLGERWTGVLSGNFQYLLEPVPRPTYSVSVVSRFHLSKEISVSFEGKRLPNAWEGLVAPQIYF